MSHSTPKTTVPDLESVFRPGLFCFSCGRNPKGDKGDCSCNHPQDPVRWDSDQIGSVVRWKGVFDRTAVVVEGGRRPTVVFSNGKTREISQDRLAKARVLLDMSSVPSVLYRLETVAARPEPWARGVRRWLSVPGRSEGLLSTTSDSRLYARSAIAVGDTESAEKAGLTSTELTWLRMHASSAAGDHKEAARLALELPVDAYPDKVGVLLCALAHSDWFPHPEQVATIAGFPGTFPGGTLVRAATGASLPPDPWDEVSAPLALGRHGHDITWTRHLMDSLSPPMEPEPGASAKATLEELAPYRLQDEIDHGGFSLPERVIAARSGVPLVVSTDEARILSQTFPSVLDDLVDDGAVSVPLGAASLPIGLRGRLAPVNLTDAEVEELGHEWESYRRAYEADRALNKGSASAAERHYSALQSLHSGDTSESLELVDPGGVLEAVAATFDTGTLDVRALSDPTAWPVLDRFIDETHAQQHPEVAGRWYLDRALAAVFNWDWREAVGAGKDALRSSRDEALRDEALNIIAFAQYQLGEDESAMSALERALEGMYTPSLQANAGVVAEHMAPERAAVHLGRLAAEAPTTELRLAAVRRAFHVWDQSRPVWEDEEDHLKLPAHLLEAIRSLVVADTPLEDHREMMRLLVYFDSEWAADPANTDDSPHSETWDHKVYLARANHDPNSYIETLVSALKENPEEDWLKVERDGFVAGIRDLIFQDIENVGPAAYAYAAIDTGLPMEPFDRVTLTFGAVISICRSLAADKNEPSDAVYDHFLLATKAMDALEPEQREMVGDLLTSAENSYAGSVAIARHEMLQQGVDVINTLVNQLYGVPKYRIDWTAVTESLRPLKQMVDDSLRTLERARMHAHDTELKEWIDALIDDFKRLREPATNPRNAL